MRNVLGLALLACLAVACGDNIDPNAVDATATDAGSDGTPLDAQSCPARAAGDVGGPCATNADCDTTTGAGDGICFNNILDPGPWPAIGYCLGSVGGCTEDVDCGDGNVCIDLGGSRACMQGCNAAGPCECPDGMVCTDGYQNTDVARMVCVPGNPNAVDGSACSTFGDCDEHSICLDDPFEHPGGQCIQLGCTAGADATCTSGGDGHCASPDVIGGGPGCLDTCVTSADCRGNDGFVCFDAGGTTGKFCRHPATGDPCTADTDCGSAVLWQCRTGVGFPGGYCTVRQACTDDGSSFGCSAGSSVCHDPLGPEAPFCVDRCTGVGQGTCRTGYLCQSVGTVRGCF